jgi:hypothetical protein
MLKKILIAFLLTSFALISFSQKKEYKAVKIANLDDQIFETSGLVCNNGFFWTHNDSGNENALFKLDTNGKIVKKVIIINAANKDWEEITQDEENFYIGDFGNNSGNRKDLKIIVIKKNEAESLDSINGKFINFNYPGQVSFTNKWYKHNFDCEAMIYKDRKIYLFSKNWSDKKTKVYSLDLNTENQTAKLIDSFNVKLLVTGASYNPNSGKIVLIGYKYNKASLKSYLIELSGYSDGGFFNGKVKRTNLHLFDSQTESVTFVNNENYLYITREGISKKKITVSKPRVYKLIPQNMSKNGYKLTGTTKKNGYDWWWHSFVGKDSLTGELRPFFIEYYVINPGLWKGNIVYGQLKSDPNQSIKPCYAMIKAGSWGTDKSQLHNFYKIPDFKASTKFLDCKIGNNVVTENILKGEVNVTKEQSEKHPEMMSDAGAMKWDLTIADKITYDVGYGSSNFSNALNLFHMYWHVQGLNCKYKGTVEYNGRKYIVEPEQSYGYQDKNWGKDYTNPWIWLNCNNFISAKTGKKVNASLDVGGGCPKVLGVSLNRRIITAFYYEGELHEFNFSKFWLFSRQKFKSYEDNDFLYWDVTSENKTHLLEIKFKCKKENLLLVNYENPQGDKNHNKLWNGGHAFGTVKFYKKGKELILIDELDGSYGGCEYGEY